METSRQQSLIPVGRPVVEISSMQIEFKIMKPTRIGVHRGGASGLRLGQVTAVMWGDEAEAVGRTEQ